MALVFLRRHCYGGLLLETNAPRKNNFPRVFLLSGAVVLKMVSKSAFIESVKLFAGVLSVL